MTENKRFVAIGVEWVDGFIQDHIGDRDLFNIGAVCKLLNELSEENEQLKQQKDKWKQQCIHFKEMLDDMDIAYLCDEWIYEELKGDDGE